MKSLVLFSFLLGSAALVAAQPQVTLVSCEQDPASRVVTVRYVVSGASAVVTAELTTNGVAVAGADVKSAIGEVNVIVAERAEPYAFTWLAERDCPCKFPSDDRWGVKLTAWSANEPPDYLAVDLTTSNTVHFYVSESAVPGGVQDRRYKTDVLLMRKIPAGNARCRIGSPTGEVGRDDAYGSSAGEIRHWVTLTDDFYMGVFEVTQRQGKRMAQYAGYTVGSHTADDAAVLPMENQTWSEIHDVTILPKLRTFTGIASFDLPTSAQWEFACRAGTETALYIGKDLGISSGAIWERSCPNLDEIAWWIGNAGGVPHPVGQKPANGFGLFDMIGNVKELCRDERATGTDYSDGSEAVDPVDTASDHRKTTRGGGFSDGCGGCRAAVRGAAAVGGNNGDLGFRLMCLPYFGK